MEQNLDNTQTVESEKQEAAHEQQEQRERTFTQTEVNGLVARESKSAVEKLLKSAGIAPEGDYKASLEAFRQWQESKNTDIQKATTQMKNLQEQNRALSEQLDALKAGIPVEKLDRYTKLAKAYQTDDTTFINALKLALKDFPVSGQGVAAAGGNPAQKPEGQKRAPLPSGATIL